MCLIYVYIIMLTDVCAYSSFIHIHCVKAACHDGGWHSLYPVTVIQKWTLSEINKYQIWCKKKFQKQHKTCIIFSLGVGLSFGYFFIFFCCFFCDYFGGGVMFVFVCCLFVIVGFWFMWLVVFCVFFFFVKASFSVFLCHNCLQL